MRKGILLSGVLHMGVLAATVVTWPHALSSASEDVPMIPVDLVTVADVSNIAPTVKEEPEPAPVEEPPPAPEVAQPDIPEPEPAPPEPAPEPPKAEAPPPVPKEDVVAAPRDPVVPRRRPQPEKPPNFDIDSVLAMLDKEAPKPRAPANARVAEQTRRGIGAQDASTLDIVAALQQQMHECWNLPAGAPNPEQLIVGVRVFLARDGDLSQQPQLLPETRSAAARNPYVNAAAQAALRAVNYCAPYRGLPPERHDQWRELDMIFDPSKMLGR